MSRISLTLDTCYRLWDSPPVAETQTNPIRILRSQNHKSLQELADIIGINLQTLYLNECGVFPTILPKIKSILVTKYHADPDELDVSYKKFILDKRRVFALEYCDKVDSLPEPNLTISPFSLYRQHIDKEFSRMGFAKTVCVEPAGLFRLETRPLSQLPGRLTEALLQVGLSSENLEELEERTSEFYSRSR